MKASKAKKIADRSHMEDVSVFKEIEQAAKKGEYSIQIHTVLDHSMVVRLRALGYKVKDQSNNFLYLYIIQWE